MAMYTKAFLAKAFLFIVGFCCVSQQQNSKKQSAERAPSTAQTSLFDTTVFFLQINRKAFVATEALDRQAFQTTALTSALLCHVWLPREQRGGAHTTVVVIFVCEEMILDDMLNMWF